MSAVSLGYTSEGVQVEGLPIVVLISEIPTPKFLCDSVLGDQITALLNACESDVMKDLSEVNIRASLSNASGW